VIIEGIRMKTVAVAFGVSVLLLPGTPAGAFGGRWISRCHSYQPACPQPVDYPPAQPVAPQPVAYDSAQPATPRPLVRQPAPVSQPAPNGVQPLYQYEAGPTGRTAYYYTYDPSGKLIVRRWMDWLYRGGREAGMPPPPLPVIGWFTGR
jgi:hypothetical protein